MARVLLGVTGGIAAYKACEVCRLLVKAGHDVIPLVTPGAERFVTAETFRALARRPPAEDVYLHLTRADLLLVAPCTANTLAKLSHGLADTVLTEAALAHRGPTLVAPAMNPRMWSHAATRANAQALLERGVVLVGPDEGETAEGELGVGRMAEPDEILRAATSLLFPSNSLLQGKAVLVSAGGTREPLDAVRYVGNRSSGRMGFALADEAAARGAAVTVVAANVGLARNPRVTYEEVETAAQLQAACERAFAACDVLLMAAAVADFRPAGTASGKVKKEGRTGMTVELEATPDVLRGLAEKRRGGQTLVGFAAEHAESVPSGNAVAEARRKLRDKGVDAIVLNDVSRADAGFEVATNEVTIVTASGERHVPLSTKGEVAAAV